MTTRWLPLALLAAACSGPQEEIATPPAPSAAPPVAATATATATATAMVIATAMAAPAASPPTPIDAALPDVVPPPLAQRASCDKGTCARGHFIPDELKRALEDGATSAIWEEAIAGKAAVAFPADAGVELAVVVLEGSVEARPSDKATAKLALDGRWKALRVPGAGVSLAAAGGKPARIAIAIAAPADASLAAHLARLDKDAKALAWKARPKGFAAVDLAARDDLAWAGGAYHARIAWEAAGPDDHPALVVDLIRFAKDAPVAEHAHDKERECLAVVEGEGDLVTKPKGLDGAAVPISLRPGVVACVPPGVRHAWKPAGTAPLLAIQVYTPPGPEQRFKKLAGKVP